MAVKTWVTACSYTTAQSIAVLKSRASHESFVFRNRPLSGTGELTGTGADNRHLATNLLRLKR